LPYEVLRHSEQAVKGLHELSIVMLAAREANLSATGAWFYKSELNPTGTACALKLPLHCGDLRV